MEGLEQFFNDNDRGYLRDPRRMAYAKLRKNIQGMDREQLEAFIKANLMIPHSQYKMALGNLINFLDKQNNMKKLDEVKQFQKIAGILKENFYEASNQEMPSNISLQFIADVGDIDEVRGTAEGIAKQLAKAFQRQKYTGISILKLAEDFYKVNSDATHAFVVGKSAPSANEIYTMYKRGDDDEAYDLVEKIASSSGTDGSEGEEDDEWANIPNTVEGWIDYLYGRANPKQKAKLASIYREQMKNEDAEDAYEFFTDLIDSSDPDAIIDLKDLNQYSGY
jgi:hypothetical protein